MRFWRHNRQRNEHIHGSIKTKIFQTSFCLD